MSTLAAPSIDAPKRRRRFSKRSVNDGFRDKDSAVATIRRIWEDGRTRMYPRLQQWLSNALFFRGDQWHILPDVTLGDELYEWDQEESEEVDPRMIANLVQKHVMSWVSRMTARNPRIHVYPVTDDEDDKDRADIHNKIIQWHARVIRFPHILMDIAMQTAIYASSFIISEFDTQGGEMVHPFSDLGPGDLELIMEPEMQEAFPQFRSMAAMLERGLRMEDMEPEGQVTMRAFAPYHFTFPNEHVRCIADAHGVLFSEVVTMQQIREEYHDHPKIDEVQPSDNLWAHQLWFLQAINRELISGLAGGSDNDADDGPGSESVDSFDTVLKHTYWAWPSKTRPQGIKAVVASDVLLEPRKMKDIGNPYWHGMVPIVQVRFTSDQTSIWGTNDLEAAIPVQEQLNQTLNQIISSRNMTSNPIILDNGSGVDYDNVARVPGEVWDNASPNRQPSYLQPPPLPAYVDRLVDTLRSVMEEIFSDHQPSRGISKAGDSGLKVRALQMADEARFAPFAHQLSKALDEVWVQQLCLMAQFQDRRKMGYVVGEQNERSYFSWDRADLLGGTLQPEWQLFREQDRERAMVTALKQRLDIETQVLPGKSQATVREDIGTLTQLGYLHPMRDQARVLQMYGYAFEAQDVMAEERQQSSMAAMENDMLMVGQPPQPPQLKENHQAHLRVHHKFVNTMKFRQLDPQLQQMMMQHMENHEKAMIMEPIRMEYLKQMVFIEFMQNYGPLPFGVPQQSQAPTGEGRRPSPAAPGGSSPGPAPGVPASPRPKQGGPQPTSPSARVPGQ